MLNVQKNDLINSLYETEIHIEYLSYFKWYVFEIGRG